MVAAGVAATGSVIVTAAELPLTVAAVVLLTTRTVSPLAARCRLTEVEPVERRATAWYPVSTAPALVRTST